MELMKHPRSSTAAAVLTAEAVRLVVEVSMGIEFSAVELAPVEIEEPLRDAISEGSLDAADPVDEVVGETSGNAVSKARLIDSIVVG